LQALEVRLKRPATVDGAPVEVTGVPVRWTERLISGLPLTIIQVMSTQSLAAVKAHFSQIIDEVASTHERVTVTRNGSPVAVILAVEDYESLMETLEILSDPKAMAAIRQAEAQMRDGEVYDEAQVRAALQARRG
jgi:antitoxin YefM